jgi:hypothetical protein
LQRSLGRSFVAAARFAWTCAQVEGVDETLWFTDKEGVAEFEALDAEDEDEADE